MGILRAPNKCCLLLQYLPRHHQLFALIFVILIQVVCGLHGVYLLQNCSNKYCFLCRIFGTIQPSPFNGHLFGVVRCRWS